jgi:uncharacterized protein (DUF1778 family)
VLHPVLTFGTVPPMPLREDYTPQKATLSIRLREEELENIKKAAKKANKSVAAFVRDSCLNGGSKK